MRNELRYGPNTALVEEFLTELKTAEYWLKPDGKPLPEWRLFTAGTLGAARDAAFGAARDAAEGSALDAAFGAARDAVVAAADAVVAAADAAWDAAWDASLFARLLVVNDLRDKVAWKHFDHANKRMRVWRKGYCLLCDVNGILYVYAREERADDNTGIR